MKKDSNYIATKSKGVELATMNEGLELSTNMMNKGGLKVATMDDGHERSNETGISSEASEVTEDTKDLYVL